MENQGRLLALVAVIVTSFGGAPLFAQMEARLWQVPPEPVQPPAAGEPALRQSRSLAYMADMPSKDDKQGIGSHPFVLTEAVPRETRAAATPRPRGNVDVPT